MDFHHDTSLRFILDDDFIFSTFRAHICSCSGKGARLWLVARSFICSFCIAQSTFLSTLCFPFGLIQLSTSIFLICECERKLTHLVRT